MSLRRLQSSTVRPLPSSQQTRNPTCRTQTNTRHSLPTPRRRNLRLHRRVNLQQHPDLQFEIKGPRRRPFGGCGRGRKSQRSVSARSTGTDRAVLYGWLESCVLDGGGLGGLRIAGQLLCALGQYQRESHDGGSVKDACRDQVSRLLGDSWE
jgi:hypothetical protein